MLKPLWTRSWILWGLSLSPAFPSVAQAEAPFRSACGALACEAPGHLLEVKVLGLTSEDKVVQVQVEGTHEVGLRDAFKPKVGDLLEVRLPSAVQVDARLVLVSPRMSLLSNTGLAGHTWTMFPRLSDTELRCGAHSSADTTLLTTLAADLRTCSCVSAPLEAVPDFCSQPAPPSKSSGCETSKAAPLGGLGILLGAWLMWRQRRPKMRPSERDKAKDKSSK